MIFLNHLIECDMFWDMFWDILWLRSNYALHYLHSNNGRINYTHNLLHNPNVFQQNQSKHQSILGENWEKLNAKLGINLFFFNKISSIEIKETLELIPIAYYSVVFQVTCYLLLKPLMRSLTERRKEWMVWWKRQTDSTEEEKKTKTVSNVYRKKRFNLWKNSGSSRLRMKKRGEK